ncbi:MAG: NHL repeat-containing protein [Mycobacterium sp.]
MLGEDFVHWLDHHVSVQSVAAPAAPLQVMRLDDRLRGARVSAVARAANGGLLMAVRPDGARHAGILSLEPRATRPKWCITPERALLCDPTAIVAGEDEIIVADAGAHEIVLLGPHGRTTYGETGTPGRSDGQLASPEGIIRISPNRIIVADTMNDRLVSLVVDRGRLALDERHTSMFLDLPLLGPRAVAHDRERGVLVVADSGNARIVEVDLETGDHTAVGVLECDRPPLSYPRSVEWRGGVLTVCDSNNNRVVDIEPRMATEPDTTWSTSGCERTRPVDSAGAGLHWPRWATVDATSEIVADGVNGRLVRVGREGQVLNEISSVVDENGAYLKLQDPHHLFVVPDGTLLVTDAAMDAVLWLDGHEVVRSIGLRGEVSLDDPHQAVWDSEKHLTIVADSGNNRVLWFSDQGLVIDEIDHTMVKGTRRDLVYPRAVLPFRGSWIVADELGPLLYLCGDHAHLIDPRIDDLASPHLTASRCLVAVNHNTILVSDCEAHRIVEVHIPPEWPACSS